MRCVSIAMICGLLPLGSIVRAAESHFDSSVEGWSIVSFENIAINSFSVLGTYSPTFHLNGGHPGGFISTDDPDRGAFTFAAPASFLGPRPGAVNGTLRYDLANPVTVTEQTADVILTGGGMVTRLLYIPTKPFVPSADFQTVVVDLSVSANWHVDTTSGAMPTDEQFRSVLANLTGLYIRGEFADTVETASLDNVSLTIIPTPGCVMLGVAISAAAMPTRRRR